MPALLSWAFKAIAGPRQRRLTGINKINAIFWFGSVLDWWPRRTIAYNLKNNLILRTFRSVLLHEMPTESPAFRFLETTSFGCEFKFRETLLGSWNRTSLLFVSEGDQMVGRQVLQRTLRAIRAYSPTVVDASFSRKQITKEVGASAS